MLQAKLFVILLIILPANAFFAVSFQTEPDSNYLFSLFESGKKAYLKNEYSKAVRKLTKFISISVPRSDTVSWMDDGYKYMQMKNTACYYLKYLYSKQGRYATALYYHDLQNRNYPHKGVTDLFEIEWKRERDSRFESECYEGMGDYYTAIKLISDFVTSRFLKYSDDHAERFVRMEIILIGLDSLKNELLSSIDNLVIKGSFIILPLLGFDITLAYVRSKIRFRLTEEKDSLRKTLNDSLETDRSDTKEIVIRNKIIPMTDEEMRDIINQQKEAFKDTRLFKLIMESKE